MLMCGASVCVKTGVFCVCRCVCVGLCVSWYAFYFTSMGLLVNECVCGWLFSMCCGGTRSGLWTGGSRPAERDKERER